MFVCRQPPPANPVSKPLILAIVLGNLFHFRRNYCQCWFDAGRRRIRGQAPQRRFQRTMPRPPPPPAQGSSELTTLTPEMIQQGMQRLFDAYNQCVTRVAQTDDRLEQFRSTFRRDALETALNVQRNSQDLQLKDKA